MEEIIRTFKDKKPYIILSTIIFFGGAILGYYLFMQNPEYFLNNLDKLLGNIKRISQAMQGKRPLYVVGMIFSNNIRALVIMMLGGVCLGLVPMAVILFNGIMVGVVLAMNLLEGNTAAFFMAAMLPHGILEIPAIIVGGAFGLKTGHNVIFTGKHKRWDLLKQNIKESFLALGVLVPVLFIAAGVEAIITPHIANLFK